MITIRTINKSWYFINTTMIRPDTSVVYDETLLTSIQARDIIISVESNRLFVTPTDLIKLEVIRNGGTSSGGNTGGSGSVAGVSFVNGRQGNVILGKTDVGLSFVDNTSDLNKPISSSTQSALNLKQDALTLKTINSLSILGAGNIDISGTPASVTPLVSSGSGVTGTSSKFAREDHKHPITPISSDLTNLLSYGTDGLYRMLPEIYLSNGPITGSAASNYKIGLDTLNQTLYYKNSGNWAKAPISVDISFTVSDHSASLPGVLPLSAPVTPSVGDVHLEIYSTNLIYWIRGATSWVQGPVLLTNPNGAVTVSPASTNTVGSVGISNLYARQDHKHPAQGISSDNLNEITVGSDGLHYFKAKTYVYEYADLGTLQATPSQYKKYGVIYITTDTDTIYRWDGTNFKQLTKNIIDGGGA